jgi:hypothetical protein
LSLYRRLLGARFDALPVRVRELHDVTAMSRWDGRADVECGSGLAARIVVRLLGLPPEGRGQPLSVTFEPVEAREVWTRTFGASVFQSVQDGQDGLLHERAGPVTFLFALEASGEGLGLVLRDVRVAAVPLPRVAHPSVRTFESERDGRYRFEVEGSLPLVGLIVRYAGWLERAGPASA